jgi:methionyl-tRNA formyltransferase
MNQRIIFMGTPPFAVASLNALVTAGMEVAAVVTGPDRPAGRGLQLRTSAVKQRALELGLPVLQPEKLKDPAFHAQLDAFDASLYIVVAFRMLPEAVWNKPPLGTVNLHASLLPDYRGAAPINWAVINGETRTGVTTFLINGKIDTGDLLLREAVAIGLDETAGLLHDRLKDIGADLLTRTAKNLFDGTSTPLPQDQFVGDVLHDAPKLTAENCRIRWSARAEQVHDQIRGLSPFPGAWTRWQEHGREPQQFKILAAECVQSHGKRPAEGVVEMHGEHLYIGCGTGSIRALEVQMQGKKPMEASAFVRGLHRREGITVG